MKQTVNKQKKRPKKTKRIQPFVNDTDDEAEEEERIPVKSAGSHLRCNSTRTEIDLLPHILMS